MEGISVRGRSAAGELDDHRLPGGDGVAGQFLLELQDEERPYPLIGDRVVLPGPARMKPAPPGLLPEVIRHEQLPQEGEVVRHPQPAEVVGGRPLVRG